MLALLVRFFVGLVKVLAVIGDLTYRRVRGRRDLHQIKPPLAGKLDGVKRNHHTQLPTVLINDTNFPRPDAIIYSNPVGLPKTPLSDKPTSKNLRPLKRKQSAAPISTHLTGNNHRETYRRV